MDEVTNAWRLVLTRRSANVMLKRYSPELFGEPLLRSRFMVERCLTRIVVAADLAAADAVLTAAIRNDCFSAREALRLALLPEQKTEEHAHDGGESDRQQ